MTPEPIRVILADDHIVVRAGIRLFLEHAGDIVVIGEADDGAAAIDLVARLNPDVAILDIQMPVLTGIEATRRLRTRFPDTAVLILTAYDDDPYVLAAVQAGAHGYVLKTATPAEIIAAVRDVYSGRVVFYPSVVEKMMTQIAGHPTGAHSEPAPEPLSDRELEVLTLAGRGYTNKAIALQLHISDRTVQGHLARIFGKMNVASRTEAVMRAVSLGWLPSNLLNQEGGV